MNTGLDQPAEPSPQITPLGDGYQLHQAQRFNRPINEVFEFFADPYNLEKITPPRLGFSVEYCEDDPVRTDTKIEYTLSLHGLPVSWETRIKNYSENEYFVDEMIAGPYRRWEHIHTFERIEEQTIVGDQVYYEMPYGWLGEIMHKILVKRDLRTIFNYRAKTLRTILG